ncbi:H-NS family nucleoid-associated regulatory protein [Halomonas sp. I5-271120]|uniref:H-NS family histone-like protein n=1 Tax=Halomonas sp. I5-271120 TaxID=3061632 RepID=UPI002714E71B|nr:H-NS family nucleoid-associated regulatory protein [Halomonas sp. I5-271120]
MAESKNLDKETLSKLVQNKNVIRAQLRRLTLSDIVKLTELVEEVHVEKQVEEEEREKEQREHLERLAEVRKIMDEHGISPEELQSEGASKKRGRPRKIDKEKSSSE